MFAEKTGVHARPKIVIVARLVTDDHPDGFALVEICLGK
jgi:hypothetical protein